MAYSTEKEIEDLIEYAEKLEREGRFDDALIVYNDAAVLGSIFAKDKIIEISSFLKNSIESSKKKETQNQLKDEVFNINDFSTAYDEQMNVQTKEKKKEKKKNKKKSNNMINSFYSFLKKTFVFLFAFCIITILPIIAFFVNDDSSVEGDNSSNNIFSSLFNTNVEINNQELLVHVVGNSLIHFKNERGYFPNSITDLSRVNPENWLSYIPENITYVTDNNSFVLTLGDLSIDEKTVKPLSLTVFPTHNQLSVKLGEDTLFNFLISSSSVPYAEESSLFVTKRNTFPNGFGSFYGTRALSLNNGFGIHGTNNPLSIGYANTNGSIAMNNTDIDILFSYVSIGTPVHISFGSPSSSTFKNFLPNLTPDEWNFDVEQVPDMIFSW